MTIISVKMSPPFAMEEGPVQCKDIGSEHGLSCMPLAVLHVV